MTCKNLFHPSLLMKTGESRTLKIYLYTRYDIRFLGWEREPDFAGFHMKIKKYEMPEEIERKIVHFMGRKYVRVRILEYEMTPQAAGSYELAFGKVKSEYREDTKFAWKPLLLDTASLHVEVK